MKNLAKEKILIVEDEREIADLINDYLSDEGFETLVARDGEEGLRFYREYRPDIAILDIMLPKVEGTEIARYIRAESAIPIIMLSARKSDTDKILSLGLGADDYITKPFSPSELVARVKAQLRRYLHLSNSRVQKDVLCFENLVIHIKNYEVSLGGKAVPLSAREFEVLRLLAQNPGQVFSRNQIFDLVWGYNEFGDLNTVTVHIKKIREKIERDPSSPHFVKTVWGVGYKFAGERA